MLSECRAIAERMNCECHSRLNFWAVQNSGSDQISPPRSLTFVCERQRTSANAERMLNYYWANWYESRAIGQFCKRFTFANSYSLKWDRALRRLFSILNPSVVCSLAFLIPTTSHDDTAKVYLPGVWFTSCMYCKTSLSWLQMELAKMVNLGRWSTYRVLSYYLNSKPC